MKIFIEELKLQFQKLQKNNKLYVSSVSGDTVADTYLKSFENDAIFRSPESSTHNCNLCKNFLRRYGNIVSIDDSNQIISLFDFESKDDSFKPVARNLSALLKESSIKNVFVETFSELKSLPYEKCKSTQDVFRLGINKNFKNWTKEEADKYPGTVEVGVVKTFNHLHLDIDKKYISLGTKSAASIQSSLRSSKEVLYRGLSEISEGTLVLVTELIKQKSLLNADSHLSKVEGFLELKRSFNKIKDIDKDAWCWLKAVEVPYALFRNELIGVLCTELSSSTISLEKACLNWNYRVDPVNYKNAVAPFTESQKQAAMKLVEEKGYLDSFNRRLATMDDIKLSEVKHSSAPKAGLKKISIFDNLKTVNKSSGSNVLDNFKDVEEIEIEDFMNNILPTVSNVELYLENKHENNLLTLTTSEDDSSKRMFQWDNQYSSTFKGGLSSKSELQQAVESRGGKTDGILRWSFSWNHDGQNQSLMDLHLFFPDISGKAHPKDKISNDYPTCRRIGWNRRLDPFSGGVQDVDNTRPPLKSIPVENITLPSFKNLPEGVYTMKVHNWSRRTPNTSGFKGEIAFGNEIFEYEYPKSLSNHEWVTVARVTLKDKNFSIEHVIKPTKEVSSTIYGLETKKFHPVNLVCLSPNYWGDNKVGIKQYFFMLEGCKFDAPIKSYHTDSLNSELTPHRRVLGALANTLMLEPQDEQLSGVGFNSTVRDSVVVKLTGAVSRVVRVNF